MLIQLLLLPTICVAGGGEAGNGSGGFAGGGEEGNGAGSDCCAARGVAGGVGLLPVGWLGAGACTAEEGDGCSS